MIGLVLEPPWLDVIFSGGVCVVVLFLPHCSLFVASSFQACCKYFPVSLILCFYMSRKGAIVVATVFLPSSSVRLDSLCCLCATIGLSMPWVDPTVLTPPPL